MTAETLTGFLNTIYKILRMPLLICGVLVLAILYLFLLLMAYLPRIITFLPTLPFKTFCAVVTLGCIEEHLDTELSLANCLITISIKARTFGGHRLLNCFRLLMVLLIGLVTLNNWFIFCGTVLFIATFTADSKCMDRKQRIMEGQARSERLWKLLLGMDEVNIQQQEEGQTDDDSDSWTWIDMDNAPPLEDEDTGTDVFTAEELKSPKYGSFK